MEKIKGISHHEVEIFDLFNQYVGRVTQPHLHEKKHEREARIKTPAGTRKPTMRFFFDTTSHTTANDGKNALCPLPYS